MALRIGPKKPTATPSLLQPVNAPAPAPANPAYTVEWVTEALIVPEYSKEDAAALDAGLLDAAIAAADKGVRTDKGAQQHIAAALHSRFPGFKLVERALMYMDGRCDGAASLDGVGFNGTHSSIGKSMAQQLAAGRKLTRKQLAVAYKIIPTYMNTQLTWIDKGDLRIEHDKFVADEVPEDRKVREDAENEAAQAMTNDEMKSWLKNYDATLIATKDITFVASIALKVNRGDRSPNLVHWVKRMAVRYPMPELKTNAELNSTTPTSQTPTEQVGEVVPVPVPHKPLRFGSTKQLGQVEQLTASPSTENVLTQHLQSSAQAFRIIEPAIRRRLALQADGSIPTIQFTRAGRDIEITPDPSQWAATQALVHHKFGCITGAAGTGKTTVERLLVMNIEDTLVEIDIAKYGASALEDSDRAVAAEPNMAGAVAFMAYTGKAMQQMKRALPELYHSRCMTIHLGLGFHPEFEEYEAFDPELGRTVMKMKRKFVPFYTEYNKMPWRVIFIDEASMVPIHLWEQFYAALRPDCKVYMIGDINQLPPVHGRSVFGFAMQKWPSFELTQIHRQKGEDNPIVENAWRVLRGELPIKVPGRCDMVLLHGKKSMAHMQIIQAAKILSAKGEFNPYDHETVDPISGKTSVSNGDMIIVSQNKDILGQSDLNEKLVMHFNPAPPKDEATTKGRRTIVSAGYDKRIFSVGDKVMATVNNHEVGVTNGMTGQIVHLGVNGAYKGKGVGASFSDADLDAMMAGGLQLTAEDVVENGIAEKDDDFKKRAASHIVTVDFGIRENGDRHVIDFATTGEVNSLMHAYAATGHKCQGSEFDTVIVVVHSSNHRMMYREWLYTAMTRAAKRYIIMYDDRGLQMALKRQRITGKNLAEKAASFNRILDENEKGATFTVPTLPEPEEIS